VSGAIGIDIAGIVIEQQFKGPRGLGTSAIAGPILRNRGPIFEFELL
jgi:hypothetical protein